MDHLYLVPIPLEGSPLKWVNCYIMTGGRRGLVVDTAFRHPTCEAVLMGALAELGLSLDETDFFITHLHVDHSGLAGTVKRPGNHVYASRACAVAVNRMMEPDHTEWMRMRPVLTGVPPEETLALEEHPAWRFCSLGPVDFDIVSPGDRLQAGDFDLTVVDLSGHSPGQTGLYDASLGILFCGDHILGRITPNITAWDLENDSLETFLNNLLRVREMAPRRLFTAHRELPEDPIGRIDEILEHHAARLEEILLIMDQNGEWMTPYEVARVMTWSMHTGFQAFPRSQKWFAVGEAMAHLQHLFFTGKLRRRDAPYPLLYRL
jgi:glyoxylase-like metal-dependent hydrolase (beta-lactamase superfamily II)